MLFAILAFCFAANSFGDDNASNNQSIAASTPFTWPFPISGVINQPPSCVNSSSCFLANITTADLPMNVFNAQAIHITISGQIIASTGSTAVCSLISANFSLGDKLPSIINSFVNPCPYASGLTPVSLVFALKKNVHYASNTTSLMFIGGVIPNTTTNPGGDYILQFNFGKDYFPPPTLLFTGMAFQ